MDKKIVIVETTGPTRQVEHTIQQFQELGYNVVTTPNKDSVLFPDEKEGLALRDEIAFRAMEAMLGRTDITWESIRGPDSIAAMAYAQADEMIAQMETNKALETLGA